MHQEYFPQLDLPLYILDQTEDFAKSVSFPGHKQRVSRDYDYFQDRRASKVEDPNSESKSEIQDFDQVQR